MSHRRIYKYKLEIKDEQDVIMPNGFVLSAHEQNGDLFIWAEVDTRNDPKPKKIQIVGTGNPINFKISDFDYYFVGTVVMVIFIIL